MKITPIAIGFSILAASVMVRSQSAGPTCSVSVTWDKYVAEGAAGFKVRVAPKGIAYGASGSKSFTAPDVQATNVTIQVEAGQEYKAVVVAYSQYGLESPPGNEVTWSAPASLPSPTGFRPVAIVYIP